jgi:hypothetical protein
VDIALENYMACVNTFKLLQKSDSCSKIPTPYLRQSIKKELPRGIKHSMEIKLFLKAIWCPGNPDLSYIGQ